MAGPASFVAGVNVRGRDIAGFVVEAQAAIGAQVELPPGYLLRWGGQFTLIDLAVPMAATDLAINSSRDFFDHPDSPPIS